MAWGTPGEVQDGDGSGRPEMGRRTLEGVRNGSGDPPSGSDESENPRAGSRWVEEPSGRSGTGRGTSGRSRTGRGTLGEAWNGLWVP